ncbi:ESX secretion-associated protein EspG [Nocardia sp. AG03]|uniref:ESX secretion-associated protein EspG n=1 Tax=Nocardia sp. AG03 TaxID=3025312 RepID=UPI002418A06A|nr:ESX secretion-associated protein EspG [Nocardia sp. AG03]
MTAWTLDPDDFAAHWYSDAVDRFPRPLHYLSRFPYQQDFDNHRARLLASYTRDELSELRRAIDTATTATWHIEISGSTTKTRDNTTAQYRIHATHNGYQAVILDQIIRNGHDGPITIHLGRPENLPQRLTTYLPKLAPGTHPAVTFPTRDTKPNHDTYLEDVAHNSPHERYRRFIDRPTHGGGSAALYQGTILDRPTPTHTLEWRDFTDDGRYTITRNPHELTFKPATQHTQSRQLAQLIDSIHTAG